MFSCWTGTWIFLWLCRPLGTCHLRCFLPTCLCLVSHSGRQSSLPCKLSGGPTCEPRFQSQSLYSTEWYACFAAAGGSSAEIQPQQPGPQQKKFRVQRRPPVICSASSKSERSCIGHVLVIGPDRPRPCRIFKCFGQFLPTEIPWPAGRGNNVPFE